MKQVKLCLTVLLLLALNSGAQAIPLSTLLSGASLTAGDKEFLAWDLSVFAGSLDAASVEVTALEDAVNPGLRFDFLNGAGTVGDLGALSFDLAYTVLVLDPTMQIVSASNWITGTTAGAGAFGSIDVLEDISDGGGFPLALPWAFVEISDGLPDPGISDPDVSEVLIPRVQEANVVNAIDVFSDVGVVGLTAFEQRFMQVPAPATFWLMCLGMAALVRLGRSGAGAGV